MILACALALASVLGQEWNPSYAHVTFGTQDISLAYWRQQTRNEPLGSSNLLISNTVPGEIMTLTQLGKNATLIRVQIDRPMRADQFRFARVTNLKWDLHTFSFQEKNFAPPTFSINSTATPVLLFDQYGQAVIFSPASEFMTSRVVGNTKNGLSIAPNAGIKELPKAYALSAVLITANRIQEAWNTWGQTMRQIYNRGAALDSQDILLQKFGYWTDNGADYYYNYDQRLGYSNTLLALRKRYQQETIPLGYMQLDSWWYDKSTTDATGKPGPAIKNPQLPEGMWNRYGGLWKYEADPYLFPNGLAAFQKELGVPLAVHNRWMDVNSPYRKEFKVDGVAALDPRFWGHVARYLKDSGVVCYEQDWLDHIYDNTPDMATDESVGDAFAGNMSRSMASDGLTMQYCMATPRFMLQALKYPNLTTIRTSDDRFGRERWKNFLYTSELAYAVGARPWCDVFRSSETENMILSVLSTGPVGTGDAMGKENKANILKAVRADGVIVKPDYPLLPTDQTFLDQAEGKDTPFVAETETSSDPQETFYFVAFAKPGGVAKARLLLPPATIYYLYNYQTGQGDFTASGVSYQPLQADGFGYWIAYPVMNGPLVILGDLSQFVPTGMQRVEISQDGKGGALVQVHFAIGESARAISGICKRKPMIRALLGGDVRLRSFNAKTGTFQVEVSRRNGNTVEFRCD